LSDIGGFGGLFSIAEAKTMSDPVLVSGTDGVGTKLKIAFLMDKHDTVGIDCVAMCVNDIVCCGARPLFFLDYIACGKNQPERIADIVKGVAEGCVQSGAALVGGETAEMPKFYPDNEYDLAGFAVGLAEREKLITGANIVAGDTLIGLASDGIHSNGYSLVRSILRPNSDSLGEYIQSLGATLGEELLKPTRIYVKSILELISKVKVKGIANITGGGFIENIPRIIPDGLRAKIDTGSWDIPPISKLLQRSGGVADDSMFNTFNMGIGMVLATAPSDAGRTLELLAGLGERGCIIGQVTAAGSESTGIDLC
jgi:phosphoribosylformylglycinamidine cyclo-ligase